MTDARRRLNGSIGLLAGALLVAPLSGCASSARDAEVAQGVAYESGVSEYDDLFEDFAKAQSVSSEVSRRLKSTQKNLADELGLEKGADVDEIIAMVDGKASELRSRGVMLYAEDAGRRTPLSTSGDASKADQKFAASVEEALSGLAELSAEIERAKHSTKKFSSRQKALQGGLGAAFRTSGAVARHKAKRNLEAVALLTAELKVSLSEGLDKLERFAEGLQVAIQAESSMQAEPAAVAEQPYEVEQPAEEPPAQTGGNGNSGGRWVAPADVTLDSD